MKELKITSSDFADRTLKVDDDVYEIIKDKSILVSVNASAFTIRTYEGPGVSSINIMNHIVNYDRYSQKPVYLDGDQFNRTRENIKIVDKYAEKRNIKPENLYGNRYRGVTSTKDKGRYTSYIYYKRRMLTLGTFKDEIHAAKVYDSAARYMFSNGHGYLNFPEESLQLSDDLRRKIDFFLTNSAGSCTSE